MPDAHDLPPELDSFLSEHNRTFLMTVRKDGSPTMHPMTGIYGEGRLSFSTYRKSVKTGNVQRTGRASCLVINGYDSPDFRAAVIRGKGSVVEARDPGERPRPHSSTVTSGIAGRSAERLQTGKRILIAVEPDAGAGFLDRLRGS